MATSIFNIPVHSPTNEYGINDIVLIGGTTNRFYYALQDVPQGINITDPYWGGIFTFNGEEKPHFFWKPSYNSSSNNEPKTRYIQYGDGYEQRYVDGINSNPFNFDLNFDYRTDAEATAIIHFLYTRRGVESFWFKAPAPYDEFRKYIAKQWTHTPVFSNNNTIRVKFEQRVN